MSKKSLSGIDVLLLIEEVSRALKKNDSSQPDSLGDRLFCMVLKLKFLLREGRIARDIVKAAEGLLQEASPQYSQFYEGRWDGEYVAPALTP